MSHRCKSIVDFMQDFAPLEFAEEWDNVGFLVGDLNQTCSRLMTCLTITTDVIEEAVAGKVDLIVSHHPFPFRPLKQITSNDLNGRMLLSLIQNQIAVYSPHTSFDSAANGINQSIATRLELTEIQPLQEIESPVSQDPAIGVGRYGNLPKPISADEFANQLKQRFDINQVAVSGPGKSTVSRVGIACGSAGQFLATARRRGCDAFVTGETNFHTCLEAIAHDQSLFLLGHYASERFAVEQLADRLTGQFSDLTVWASKIESDPIRYV